MISADGLRYMGRIPITTREAAMAASRTAAVSLRENCPLRMPLRRIKKAVAAARMTNPAIRTQNQKKGVSVSMEAVRVLVFCFSLDVISARISSAVID
jgi:hypothetical protein